jgi:hypothetical protein
MDINQQKEQFSITYVRAIAAVAGYSLYRPEIDNDSVASFNGLVLEICHESYHQR